MNKTYKVLRKSVILLVGSAVFLFGIVLLVIPGPGLLVMAAGLLILSIEFEWAERHQKNIRRKINEAYEKAKNKGKNTNNDSHKHK